MKKRDNRQPPGDAPTNKWKQLNKKAKMVRSSILAISLGAGFVHPGIDDAYLDKFQGDSLTYFKQSFLKHIAQAEELPPGEGSEEEAEEESEEETGNETEEEIAEETEEETEEEVAEESEEETEEEAEGETEEEVEEETQEETEEEVEEETQEETEEEVAEESEEETEEEAEGETEEETQEETEGATPPSSPSYVPVTNADDPYLEAVSGAGEVLSGIPVARFVASEQEGGTVRVQIINEGMRQATERLDQDKLLAIQFTLPQRTSRTLVQLDELTVDILTGRDTRLALRTNEFTVSYPADVWKFVRAAADDDEQVRSIHIDVEHVPLSSLHAVQRWADDHRARTVGSAYSFELMLTDGQDEISINDFGTVLVERSIRIPEHVSADRLTVFLVKGDELYPVPFFYQDGWATVRTPANAAVVMVERAEATASTGDDWGAGEASLLAGMGVLEPESPGVRFKLNMTRAEFADMLVRIFGLGFHEVGDATTFGDLPEDESARRFIAITVDAGLFRGTSESTFDPDAVITREQAIVVLSRAIQQFRLDIGSTSDNTPEAYRDGSGISEWALDDMRSAIGMGLIEGFGDGTIRSTGGVTNQQAAVLLYKFLKHAGLIRGEGADGASAGQSS